MNNILKESSYSINKAVKLLSTHKLVSLKAETVYGLACDPSSIKSIKNLYDLKKRPYNNPLIIHVSSIQMLNSICHTNKLTEKIISQFWPGPLTIILPRKKNKNILDFAVSGLDTIAVRMPRSPVFLSVLKRFGKPIAAPSANESGYISSTKAMHVFDSFKKKVDLIIDSGQSDFGLESTIIDLSSNKIVLRRPGVVDIKSLEVFIGKKIYELKTNTKNPNSPGQFLKHYSPTTPLKLNVKLPRDGDAFLGFGKLNFNHKPSLNLSKKGNLNEAAFNLFNFLRKLDKLNKKNISVYPIPKKGIGKAINERLARAEYK